MFSIRGCDIYSVEGAKYYIEGEFGCGWGGWNETNTTTSKPYDTEQDRDEAMKRLEDFVRNELRQ